MHRTTIQTNAKCVGSSMLGTLRGGQKDAVGVMALPFHLIPSTIHTQFSTVGGTCSKGSNRFSPPKEMIMQALTSHVIASELTYKLHQGWPNCSSGTACGFSMHLVWLPGLDTPPPTPSRDCSNPKGFPVLCEHQCALYAGLYGRGGCRHQTKLEHVKWNKGMAVASIV